MKLYGNWSKDEALFHAPSSFGLSGRWNIDYDCVTFITLNGMSVYFKRYDFSYGEFPDKYELFGLVCGTALDKEWIFYDVEGEEQESCV